MPKFDSANHIRKYPEITTKENVALIEEITAKSWRTMDKRARDHRRIEIAQCLKLPQEARVNRGLLSQAIIETSKLIKSAIHINEKELTPGKKVRVKSKSGNSTFTILRISPRFTIYLKETSGEFNPLGIEPE